MKIAVVGTGYVGLVTGTCFAESGNDVVCVDTDESKVERLKRGEIPIYEPGLEEMVKRNAREERLRFTTNIEEAVERSLMIFIAVGTPPGEDGSADLQYVLQRRARHRPADHHASRSSSTSRRSRSAPATRCARSSARSSPGAASTCPSTS